MNRCFVCNETIWALQVLHVTCEKEVLIRHRTCGPGSYHYTRKFPDHVSSLLYIQREQSLQNT